MDYPLSSYLQRDGHWTTHDPLRILDTLKDDLLFDLETIYAFQEGENDNEEWILLGQAQSGYYVFMEARCDYTGFDCQGGGTVALTDDWDKMWNYYMDENSRDFVRRRNRLSCFSINSVQV